MFRTVWVHFRRLHPNEFEEDEVWLEEDQPHLLYIHVSVRLIQWHSEVKLSLDVFQTYSAKNILHYSAFVWPILIAKLALFVGLQLCSVTRSGNANRRNANLGEPLLGGFVRPLHFAAKCGGRTHPPSKGSPRFAFLRFAFPFHVTEG